MNVDVTPVVICELVTSKVFIRNRSKAKHSNANIRKMAIFH